MDQQVSGDVAHRLVVFDDENALRPANDFRRHRPDRFRLHLPLAARQMQAEDGACAELAVHCDKSAGLTDKAEHHRQTKPGAVALFFGGEERFKYPIDHIWRHAGAGIGHLDHDVIARHHIRTRAHLAVADMNIAGDDRHLAAQGHGVACVGGQVGNGRLQPRCIGVDWPDIFAEFEGHRHALAQHVVEQVGDGANPGVHVDLLRCQRLTSGESEQLRDQIGAAQ